MEGFAIRCIGRVQGVFFRAGAKAKADELGIHGWVKNEPNGDVLIHAEGNEKALNELVKWCKRGPDFARVQNVDVSTIETKLFSDFQILYD